jgi:radical SAM superfamily enzyme YgiQ (UPF0313 family)
VVAQPEYAHLFLDENTQVIGVHTMDPAGLGPVTMMFTNGRTFTSLEEKIFSNFISKLDNERNSRSPKAKIMVGGPGSWELSYLPEMIERLHINNVIQGETEDSAVDLFDAIAEDKMPDNFMFGYQTFDDNFRKVWNLDRKQIFLTRGSFRKQFPLLTEIPLIRGATMKGLVEVMRGCGIGCDFCEVTLRPLRYYDPEDVAKEIQVNIKAGLRNAWFHSDEIFAYAHGPNFEPNQDALLDLFSAIMNTGIHHGNPTHGRISIPAAYPDLIAKLSEILRAGPSNWIGIQIGLETGSDELARKHMPNKTLPLHFDSDGSWSQIVTEGLVNLNRHYWRPALTVQIGQADETPEDNWMTVGLINDLSAANLEFTVTPLVNVPLGLLKTRGGFYPVYDRLDEAQASVIYACFRHMQKILFRNIRSTTKNYNPVTRFLMVQIMTLGMAGILRGLEHMFKVKGFRMDKAKIYSLDEHRTKRLASPALVH